MNEDSAEVQHPNKIDILHNKVESLLHDVRPTTHEWKERDLSEIRGSSNGLLRAIYYYAARRHHYISVVRQNDFRTFGGYEGIQITESKLSVDGNNSKPEIKLTGYYVYDQGSFLMGRAVWEAPLLDTELTEREAETISQCLEGNINNRVAAETELQRFKTDHNM